jgi:hypothetical protein
MASEKDTVELDFRLGTGIADDIRGVTAALDELQKRMAQQQQQAKQAGGGGKHGASQTDMVAAVAKGNIIADVAMKAATMGYEAAKFLATHSFNAANAQEENITELGRTLARVDKDGKMSMQDLRGVAEIVNSEFDAMSEKSGISGDVMSQVFGSIAEQGTHAADKLVDITKNMTLAGKAAQGGPQGLAMGFRQLQIGMVNARNPLVQFIASTGTLKGSAHAVTKQLQQMTGEERLKKAEEALKKMADRMKDAPKSIKEMGTQLGSIATNLSEDLGTGLSKAFQGGLADFVKMAQESRDQFSTIAKQMGAMLGNALGAAVRGVTGLMKEWDINEKLRLLNKPASSNAGAGADKSFLGQVFDTILPDSMAEAARNAKLKVAGTPMLSSPQARQEADAIMKNLHMELSALAKNGDAGKFNQMSGSYASAMDAYGYSPAMKEGVMNRLRDEMQSRFTGKKSTAGIAADQGEFNADAGGFSYPGVVSKVGEAQSAQDSFLRESSSKAAADIVLANKDIEASILSGAVGISGGAKAFVDLLDGIIEKTPEQVALLERMKNGLLAKPGAGNKVNFNNFGGIQIKQEFREQDPDRIAVVFQRDLFKHAENKVQSMMTPGFSG